MWLVHNEDTLPMVKTLREYSDGKNLYNENVLVLEIYVVNAIKNS